MEQISISHFSSLNFDDNWKNSFETNEYYVQSFSQSDVIRVFAALNKQVKLSVSVENVSTGDKYTIEPYLIEEEDRKSYLISVTGLDFGCYQMDLTAYYTHISSTVIRSDVFRIVPDEELEDTILVSSTNHENDLGTIFYIGDEPVFYNLRVEGGFLNQETGFEVEDESFRDQVSSLHQLDALPYERNTLTIGRANGVPIWVARKLNCLMSTTDLLLNGKAYTRSEGSSPQITQIKTYYPLYVFKIDVEPVQSSMFNVYFELDGFRIFNGMFNRIFN